MNERLERLGLLPVLGLVYVLLLLPVVIVVLTSFTVSEQPTIPYDGVTLEWYVELLYNSRIYDSIISSVIVGVAASLLAGAIGTATAFGFVRSEIPYKETLATVMLLPIMISPVIIGLALLRFGGTVGMSSGYPVIILTHTVLTFPFVFLIVRSRLLTFDTQLEDASRTLGANNIETVCNVTLPLLAPAVAAGMLLAFVISFGEFTATQFLTGAGSQTVPIYIYNQIGTGLSPEISALATVLVVVMIAAGYLGDRLT
ncbi:spermidine/putrescine transport system permease protein [Natronorubrum sediminis]|uniref:Spermidine/putrescine transport system permease protein n=1 Tax=Natronorubrum sediminis TaxID=640943 RepID=A0A1H6FY82_9EURY|nr:ABC transporter permease [Natronorubrum sediminis]SEH14973.1 spermidine/putrescine transport system permease protein [Natronorubrum sediminis]